MSTNEIVSHSNNHAAEIVEFAASIEAWNDPVTRRDYFEHLSGSDFLALTQQVASLVRTGDSNGQQPFDGNNVTLMTHKVPDHRDKEDLLLQTWHTARELLRDQTIDDQDALEYAALTAAAGILYIHPFVDGNGRASRALSFLISTGAQDTGPLETALSDTSQR
jgi:hypothetical protein